MSRYLSVAVALLVAVVLTACAKITIPGPKGQPQSGSGQASQTAGQQPVQQSNAGPPPLDGEWCIGFSFKDQQLSASAILSQSGNQFEGQGVDDGNGAQWVAEQGQIQGEQVSFLKKYINAEAQRPPIEYVGQYVFDNDIGSWTLQGTYTVNSAEGPIQGKWLAAPNQPTAPEAAAAPPEQTHMAPASTLGQARPTGANISGGDKPRDISGRYAMAFTYKFKKVLSNLWILQDGGKLSGHGIDTSTAEKFVIEKGWYAYPKVTLIRSYTRGHGAKESRKVTFKGKVGSDGRTIQLKGETEFGGPWDAHLIR